MPEIGEFRPAQAEPEQEQTPSIGDFRPIGSAQRVGEFRPLPLVQQEKTALDDVAQTIKNYIRHTVKPFSTALSTYKQEATQGRQMVAEAISPIKQTPITRALKILGGTAQYVMSPITGFARGFVKEPIKDAAEIQGGGPELSEFLGRLGEEAVYFIPAGGTLKATMLSKSPGLKAAQELKTAYPKIAETTRKVSKEVAKKEALQKGFKELGEITAPKVRDDIIDGVTKGAVYALEGKTDPAKRIFKQIADSLSLGEIDVAGLPEVLRKHDLSPAQFAQMYKDTVSFGGRILGYHSRAAKQLKHVFKDSPEAVRILETAFKQEKAPYLIDKAMDFLYGVDNFRRAMLVGQVATAVRNMWSQAGRISMAALDESIQGITRKLFNVDGVDIKDAFEGLNHASAAISRMTPKGRRQLFDILEANQGSLSKLRMLSQPVHEAQLTGPITKVVGALNRVQEHFFRKIAFEAKLRQLLGRKGLKLNEVKPDLIPEEMISEAVNYSLEMTFAASPKSNSVKNFIKGWNTIGGTLINPFPRFNFANALPFVFDHSPLGYLNALKPSTLKALASGNSDEFAKAASRATIGTMMLDSATRLRQSKYAGEKWYEIKIGENKDGSSRVLDTRAFAPFSTYLFIAEAFAHPERLQVHDYAQAAVGLNRIAGTGLVVTDWLRAKSGEQFKTQVGRFVGQVAGSFLTPLRTFSDVYGALDEKENIYRDIRDNPVLAPIVLNLPGYSQMVPESKSPLKAGSIIKAEDVGKIPGGVFRQLSGISMRTKNRMMREVDRTGLEWRSVFPTTGNPKADRYISEQMAPIVEKIGPMLLSAPNYKKSPINMQRLYLSEMFKEARGIAKAKLYTNKPGLALRVVIDNLNKNIKETVKEKYPQTGE